MLLYLKTYMRIINSAGILENALQYSIMGEELKLLSKEQKDYTTMKYTIKKYELSSTFSVDDTGMLVYAYNADKPTDSYLELQFYLADVLNKSLKSEQLQTIHFFQFRFTKAYLSSFIPKNEITNTIDEVLSFQHHSPFHKIVSLCGRTRIILENLINHNYKNSLANIFINTQIQTILLYSAECLVEDKFEGFACKFLENELDRNKVKYAREILLKNLSTPITIKELSRLVGTNECYLKKGFKEIYGTTIFDFYQNQRMEYAKALLYEKDISVTEVAFLLGYSSISHFSTAFRKQTGLKPCELLLR